MSVLQSDISLFPEDSFSTAREDLEIFRWWVLHTRPRAEKTVARILASKRIPFFLPLYTQRKRVQRRTTTSDLPLFPGYLFLRGGDEERVGAFETNRIANCLRVEDQGAMDRDLARVHASIASGLPLLPEESIQPGTLAEIVSGPLAGHHGIIVRSGKHLKFVIEVNFLQRGATIEIDASMVRPLK